MAKNKSKSAKNRKSNDFQPEQKENNVKSPTELSAGRKQLFTITAISLPFVLLILLELTLQIFSYGGDTTLFVSIPNKDSKFYGINVDIGKRYFHRENFIPSPRKDLFLKKKPDNCYRIFVLGGSTTAGFPYGNNFNFARILKKRLSDTFPQKQIEVVNTAMTAINTFTQLDMMDEIIEQEPDAILVYSGHNEYYGALGPASVESVGGAYWLVKTYLAIQDFKVVILLRNGIGKFRNLLASFWGSKADPTSSMMARIVGNKEIIYQSSTYHDGIQQFKNNLSAIIEKAKRANCRILLSELVSNVRDQPPFVSVTDNASLTADQLYKTARSLEKKGLFDSANAAYYRAKDLDALRFRAPEALNVTIHKLAKKYELPVVPMKAYFEDASTNGLIGNSLMHEHLHPNKQGYFLMAEAFFETMRQYKFVDEKWSENVRPSGYYKQNWGFTELDDRYAELNIAHLKNGWPFKKDAVGNDFLTRYRPKTLQDSLALETLRNKQATLERSHMQLADYFERTGDLERAWLEHKALIYTVPHLEVFYEKAIKVLLKMKRFEEVVGILREGLSYGESEFFLEWLGRVHLMTGRNGRGITYLERALKLAPDNVEIQFFTCAAYYTDLQLSKASELYNSLSVNPNAQNMKVLQSYKTSSQQALKFLQQAEQALQQNNVPIAVISLKMSLQKQSSARANALMGQLLLKKGDNEAAVDYLESAYIKEVGDKAQILQNLTIAYLNTNQIDNAKRSLMDLKTNYPHYPDLQQLESRFQRIQ